MKDSEVRELRLQLNKVENELAEIQQDATTLHDGGVDTTKSADLSNRQQELQDELEQLITDLLAVLDMSHKAGERDLPGSARRPVKSATLPPTRFDDDRLRGVPGWVKGRSATTN